MGVCGNRPVPGGPVPRYEIDTDRYQNRKQEEHPIVDQHFTQGLLRPEQLGRRAVRVDAEQSAYLLMGKTVQDGEPEHFTVSLRQGFYRCQQQPQLNVFPSLPFFFL